MISAEGLLALQLPHESSGYHLRHILFSSFFVRYAKVAYVFLVEVFNRYPNPTRLQYVGGGL